MNPSERLAVAVAALERIADLAGRYEGPVLQPIREIANDALAEQRQAPVVFDLVGHLHRQVSWSIRTFGPGDRSAGVSDHIRKELREIEDDPDDLKEWIDVVILAFDGAWRTGATPEEIVGAFAAKHEKNERRSWPDWRTADPTKAIEHVRGIHD